MTNYGRERLDARFSITIDRSQYLKLKNFTNTTHFKNAQLRGFKRNYEHELLNSRTQIYFSSQDIDSILRTQDFNDNTHLKNARLRGFMRNYGHELLNSRTQRYFSSQHYSTYRVHVELWA
ncbi:hypothetical protein MTR67_024062 [Solanum verrucosum]|uniref:Uncharacterized protein n=1 Tax=Solanum verrucosum TaxID=315347 RepID=A0AAF0QY39_SOLVR|nr:hypothetical protein MTR67_024062 [Solanum verrucosum]